MQGCELFALLSLDLVALLLVNLVHISLHFVIKIFIQLLILLYKRCIVTLVTSALDALLKFLLILRSDTPLEVLSRVKSRGKRALVHPQVVACRLNRVLIDAIARDMIGSFEHISRLLQSERDGLIKCTADLLLAITKGLAR